MAPPMARCVGSSFLGKSSVRSSNKLNFEVSHGKVNQQTYARLNKAGTGLKGMPNFCQGHQGLSDYPIWTIYWLFWVNHFGTRKNKIIGLETTCCLPALSSDSWQGDQSAMVLENTDTGIQKQGHTVEGMWTRILFQLVSSWNPVPCQSNMNWPIWLPNPEGKKILCNSQQCTWFHVNLGIQVFSGQYSEFHLISIFYLEWWSYYHPFCLPVVALLRGHYQAKRCTLP